jgi:hypothetical protein
VICVSLYRYEVQQQEHVTTAEDWGGASDGCMCSVCGSMAKQVIAHLHPVHFTIQAEDMRRSIGEDVANVKKRQPTGHKIL